MGSRFSLRKYPMSLTRWQKRIIWTCLIALWLSLFMPAISQSVQARGNAQMFNDFCTSSGMVHLDANASLPTGGDAGSRDDHQGHGSHGDACGYCSLMAHSPLVTSYVDLVVASAPAMAHERPLLYDYLPPRPFRGQTNPLDPPPKHA